VGHGSGYDYDYDYDRDRDHDHDRDHERGHLVDDDGGYDCDHYYVHSQYHDCGHDRDAHRYDGAQIDRGYGGAPGELGYRVSLSSGLAFSVEPRCEWKWLAHAKARQRIPTCLLNLVSDNVCCIS
jgi:hypothetical protein